MRRTLWRPAWLVVASWASALACTACGPTPDERQVFESMIELDRLRFESLLCLDEMDLGALVRLAGRSDPCEVLFEEGDPSFGTVRVIGQLHSGPSLQSTFEDESVAQYQLAVLRLLLDAPARTVFVEGLAAGSALAMDDRMRALLRDTFARLPHPDSFPSGLDTRQFEVLRKSLAVVAFQALRPEATVLGADDTSALRKLEAEDLPWALDDSLTMEHRERVAMGAVCSYLSVHRGEDVHLVFGAAHTFDSSVIPRGDPVPRILVTTFPGLAATSSFLQCFVMDRLNGEPDLLREYLNRLVYLDPDCFEMLPEREQLQALRIPLAPAETTLREQDLERLLIRGAKTRAVRTAISRDGFQYVPARSP